MPISRVISRIRNLSSRCHPERGGDAVEYVIVLLAVVVIGAGLLAFGTKVAGQVGEVGNTIGGWFGSGEDVFGGGSADQTETAFAVYSADDDSLCFYKRTEVPKVGDNFEFKTVSEVYTGFETTRYWVRTTDDSMAHDWTCPTLPWWSRQDRIKTVTVVDEGIAPTSIDGWFMRMPNLTIADLSNLDCAKTDTARCAFLRCSSLVTLESPKNFHPVDLSDFVYCCTSLKNFDTSGWDMSRCFSISWAFSDCKSLKTIPGIEKWDTASLMYMGGAFAGCSGFTALDVSHFDTASVVEMESAFSGLASLTSLDLSNFDTRNVKYMYYLFSGCSALTALDLDSFDTSNVTDMHDMFDGCKSLKSLKVGGFDTQNVTDASAMFYGCSSLKLDCSSWNVDNIANQKDFNAWAPGVILPKAWQ